MTFEWDTKPYYTILVDVQALIYAHDCHAAVQTKKFSANKGIGFA